MSYLSTHRKDNIVVIILNQPDEKVNKLTEELIEEFKNLFDNLEKDTSVKGIVLKSGKDKNFIAGADVEMLKRKKAPREVEMLSWTGNHLLSRLERFEIPVVAAIHGTCMGGGLEVAMACHYRVASDHPDTVFAQPEVKLGLVPGGGGTQRLPRLIGLQKALNYLLTGKNIYPRQAKKMGLVDELVHKDAILTAAMKAVDDIRSGRFTRKDKRNLLEKLLEKYRFGRNMIFSQARKRTKTETRGNYPAPIEIIDCVEEGYKFGFLEGLEKESISFGKMAATPESKALVELFFAMQKAKKNPEKKLARSIEKVAVLGAGLMGAGIADVSANNNFKVLLKDQTVDQAAKGKETIWKNLDQKKEKKIISEFERDRISSLVTATDSYLGFENAELVIEAVFEDLELKKKLFREVEKEVPDHCILASNTSSLPISTLAEGLRRPDQVIGMHYFSPVQKMPLLEIIKTDKTADWVTATAREVGVRQGKHVIVVKDGPGFYTTRILAAFMNEALLLLEDGAEIEHLDETMKNFGFPVGPAALLDEVGIDIAAHVSDVLSELFSERGFSPSKKAAELLEAGFKGKKNRKGFYKYAGKKSGKSKKEPNPEIYRFFGGQERQKPDEEVIQQRMVLIMANEAVHCLQEEILSNPIDGDLGAVLGLGFPPFHGGPFRYIDQKGTTEIAKTLNSLQHKFGPRFSPAELLTEKAKKGRSFLAST